MEPVEQLDVDGVVKMLDVVWTPVVSVVVCPPRRRFNEVKIKFR